jgi:hypothetical protein
VVGVKVFKILISFFEKVLRSFEDRSWRISILRLLKRFNGRVFRRSIFFLGEMQFVIISSWRRLQHIFRSMLLRIMSILLKLNTFGWILGHLISFVQGMHGVATLLRLLQLSVSFGKNELESGHALVNEVQMQKD